MFKREEFYVRAVLHRNHGAPHAGAVSQRAARRRLEYRAHDEWADPIPIIRQPVRARSRPNDATGAFPS